MGWVYKAIENFKIPTSLQAKYFFIIISIMELLIFMNSNMELLIYECVCVLHLITYTFIVRIPLSERKSFYFYFDVVWTTTKWQPFIITELKFIASFFLFMWQKRKIWTYNWLRRSTYLSLNRIHKFKEQILFVSPTTAFYFMWQVKNINGLK